MSQPKQYKKAIKAFAKTKDNMVTLEVGDILEIQSAEAKGWFQAKNIKSNLSGWAPVAYCAAATEQEIKAALQPKQAPSQQKKPEEDAEDYYYEEDVEEEKQATKPAVAQQVPQKPDQRVADLQKQVDSLVKENSDLKTQLSTIKAAEEAAVTAKLAAEKAAERLKQRNTEQNLQIESLKAGIAPQINFAFQDSEQLAALSKENEELKAAQCVLDETVADLKSTVEVLTSKSNQFQQQLKQFEQEAAKLQAHETEVATMAAQFNQQLLAKEQERQRDEKLIKATGLSQIDLQNIEQENNALKKENEVLTQYQTPDKPQVKKRRHAKTRQTALLDIGELEAMFDIQ